MHGSTDFKQCCRKRSPTGHLGQPRGYLVPLPSQGGSAWVDAHIRPTRGTRMSIVNIKPGMGGTKRTKGVKGEERRGNEEDQVEGAALNASPLASTVQGGNQAEGHDPRLSAPSAGNQLAGPDIIGTDQPTPDPFVGQVEPSTATAGSGPAERRARPATRTRPGPRCSKSKGTEEEEEEPSEKGRKSRSRSRSDGRDRSNIRDRSDGRNRKEKEERREKSRKRKRDTENGDQRATGPQPYDSGDDTADDVGLEELGPADDTMSEASRHSVEPREALSTASDPLTGSRGRGRPPTTGQYIGLAAAKREAAEAEERLLMVRAEKEVLNSGISRWREQRRGRREEEGTSPVPPDPRPAGAEDVSRRSVEDLGRGVNIAAETIEKVAARSKNLKGTWVRELKEAAAETREVCAELSRRLQTEGDVPGLRAENASLRLQVEQLGGELRELRAVVEAMSAAVRTPLPPAPPPPAAPRSRSTSRASAVSGGGGGKKRGAPGLSSSEDSGEEQRGRKKKMKAGSKTPPQTAKGGRTSPSPTPMIEGGSSPERGGSPPPQASRKEAEPPVGANDALLAQIASLIDAKLAGFRVELDAAVGGTRQQTVPPQLGPSGKTGAAASQGGRTSAPPPRSVPTMAGERETGASVTKPTVPAPSKKKKKKKKKGGGAGPPPSGQPQQRQQQQRQQQQQPQPAKKGNADSASLPPQPPPTVEVETWAEVVGRKERSAAQRAATRSSPGQQTQAGPGNGKGGRGQGQLARATPRLPRVPGAAAITVTAQGGEGGLSLKDAMSRVRENIRMEDLGIEEVTPKRAATGGLILEVPGSDSGEKADRLAALMREVLEGTGVRVARPTKCAEVRVQGLDDSITPEEVTRAVALAGGCEEGDVRAGVARRAPTGLYAVWVRVPLSAARKLAESGKVRVGWVNARVEVLAARPLQCYRCLEVGHTRQRCTGEVDRSGRCYRCGAAEHRAAECSAALKCPLCSDMGRPSNHRLGTACGTPAKRGRRRRKAGAQTQGEEAPPAKQGAGPSQAGARAQPGGSGEAPRPQREKRQGGAAVFTAPV